MKVNNNAKAAVDRLLAEDGYNLKPGDVLYTTTLHTSRSGMTRHIKVTRITDGSPFDISGLVATATGQRWHNDGGVVVGGCGMDMGFSLVYGLSRTLYPNGHDCTGTTGCPSNDHNNDWNEATKRADVHFDIDPYGNDRPALRAIWGSEWEKKKADIMTTELGYRTDRHHDDGGYAISQRWL